MLGLGNVEVLANLAGEIIVDLGVARDRRPTVFRRVYPSGMASPSRRRRQPWVVK
jgi:hypothetical protein